MSSINRGAVYWQITKSWVYSLVILCVSLFLMLVICAFAVRLVGPVALTLIGLSLLLSIAVYIFSERLVVYITDAVPVNPCSEPHLWRIYDQICEAAGFRTKPRLYIAEQESPNAFAFGPGFFGQSAIAVTRPLLSILSGEQLKGVLAHELGHIAAKDVGLMTVVALIGGTGGQLSQYLFRSGFRAPHTFLFGCLLWLCSRLLLPIGQMAISREREKAADAYAAWRCGTPLPLIGALTILEEQRGRMHLERSFLEKLMISHPDTKDRIRILEGYR